MLPIGRVPFEAEEFFTPCEYDRGCSPDTVSFYRKKVTRFLTWAQREKAETLDAQTVRQFFRSASGNHLLGSWVSLVEQRSMRISWISSKISWRRRHACYNLQSSRRRPPNPREAAGFEEPCTAPHDLRDPSGPGFLRAAAHHHDGIGGVVRPVRAAPAGAIGSAHRPLGGEGAVLRIDDRHPLFPELKQLVCKTSGLGEILQEALAGTSGVEVAFIYGSVAKGEERPTSDLDLFILGTPDREKLAAVLEDAERRLGREINLVTMTMDEWRARISAGEGFVEELLRSPKILLIDDERSLRRD